jgi:hypothetical protein
MRCSPPRRLHREAWSGPQRKLSDQRRAALVEDFIDGSIRTPEVQTLLKLRTPQTVHRLRSRGKLIGSAVGTQTCFPAWQFDSGDSLDGRLVAAATASPQDGDRGRRE